MQTMWEDSTGFISTYPLVAQVPCCNNFSCFARDRQLRQAVHRQRVPCLLLIMPSCVAGTLLGGITFRNVLVQYDRANGRVGFGPG